MYIKIYKSIFRYTVIQGLELKGQMVYCSESDSILFVSSPFLNGLDGLTGRGLFISDIPLHDATRDVILVGEQARAQVTIVIRIIQTVLYINIHIDIYIIKSLLSHYYRRV